MKSAGNISYFVFGVIVFFFFPGMTELFATGQEPQKIDILSDWRGDYPVAEICRLPEDMRSSRIGYINDAATFTSVWQAFKPGDKTPEVDFRYQLVLFARNVAFFNRIGISAVLLKDGGAQVLAMETLSALPIEEWVGMALAVIPAAGVRYIAAGNQKITITINAQGSPADLLNATYRIGDQKITLYNGFSEQPVVPGSAAKMVTKIVGTPVLGDLDGDGDNDAALILVHCPGGSGTFYYAAAAMNHAGQYQTTDAVLLGDRIFPQDIQIANGIIVARYTDREPHDPMTSDPSVEKKTYLHYDTKQLQSIKALEVDEQVVAGWVTIGHEVRSFRSCYNNTDFWISGDSPSLVKIMAVYKKTRPGIKPGTPLFMVLAGKMIPAPLDGFGADYASAFRASTVLIDNFTGENDGIFSICGCKY